MANVGITTQRVLEGGTPIIGGGVLVPALLGQSRGANTAILNEEVTRGATDTDSLANTVLRSIQRIGNSSGAVDYSLGVHYVLTGDTVDWTDAPAMLAPELEAPALITAGGSFSVTGTYFYTLSSFDQSDVETVQGNSLSILVDDITKRVQLDWGKVPNASKYRIYRNTSDDFTSGTLQLTEIADPETTTYEDTGSATTGTFPPATNATQDRPGNTDLYYVSYTYAEFTYNTPTKYFSLSQVYADHGVGSDIVNAARMAMGKGGIGNEAPAIEAIATSGSAISVFQTALTALETRDVQLIVPLKNSDTLDTSVAAHCTLQSDVDHKRERVGVYSMIQGVTIGSLTQAGTVLYKAASFNNDKRAILAIPDGGTCYLDNYEETDGTYTQNSAVDGWLLAAAVAGRIAALSDPATPPTGKPILGVNSSTVTLYLETEKGTLETAGVCLVEDRFGNMFVRHGLTTDTTLVENAEISIVLAEDELRRRLRTSVQKFIGRKGTSPVIMAIENDVKFVLDRSRKDELIAEYFADELTVEQDPLDRTIILITFRYSPQYPINQLRFRYGFSIRTGSEVL